MSFNKNIIIAATLVATVIAGRLGVVNNCVSSVYCYAARGQDKDHPNGITGPTYTVEPGHSYLTDGLFYASSDSVGVSLKCSPQADASTGPYQMQATVSPDGITWYDLSAVNGNPFGDQHRRISIPTGPACTDAHCIPESNDCQNNAPTDGLVFSCRTVEDVYMILC